MSDRQVEGKRAQAFFAVCDKKMKWAVVERRTAHKLN